jgi:hypothetical protein
MSDLFSSDVLDALWQQLTERGLLAPPIDFEFARAPEDELDGPLEFLLQDHVALFEGYHFECLGGDSDGAVVARVHYPGLVGPRPVLSFGVDGEVALIASSEHAFLRQLASGCLWRDSLDTWTPTPHDMAPVQRLVRGIIGGVEADPNGAMAAARAAHPALVAWIDRLLAAAAMN